MLGNVTAASALAADSGSSVDLSPLLQYGVLGFFSMLALLALYSLWRRELSTADYHRQRADELERELRDLNKAVQEQVIPALRDWTTTAREVLTAMALQDRKNGR